MSCSTRWKFEYDAVTGAIVTIFEQYDATGAILNPVGIITDTNGATSSDGLDFAAIHCRC